MRETYVSQGLYDLPQVARILGISIVKLRRWLEEGGFRVGVKRDPALLTFLDLMELQFIKLFRDEGVSLPTIRRAAQTAAKKFRTDYPFAVKRFDTDGRSIFATLIKQVNGDDAQLVEDLNRGQYVFDAMVRPFFKKLEYRTSDREQAIRFWPLGTTGRIVLDPQRKFGQPIDNETGIPTKSLYDSVIAGGGQDLATVARWFDVPIDAVRAAVAFEKRLSS